MNLNNVSLMLSAVSKKQYPDTDMPEIAFAGRSNVGKSSLINKLLNRKKLARISSVPGKTITINFYKVDKIKFVDLPGYGYAKVSFKEKERWSELMESYFNSSRKISLVVQLVDMRHPVTKDDLEMIEFLNHYNYKFVVVATKSDKLNKTEYKTRKEELEKEIRCVSDAQIIPFSSVNGEGVEELKKAIEESVV